MKRRTADRHRTKQSTTMDIITHDTFTHFAYWSLFGELLKIKISIVNKM